VIIRKKMGQEPAKEEDLIGYLELYTIFSKHDSKQEKRDIEEFNKQLELYELFKTLNPRYFENIVPLKEAKLKVDSSDIIYSSKYNIFRPY
jgi:hypothetical protein